MRTIVGPRCFQTVLNFRVPLCLATSRRDVTADENMLFRTLYCLSLYSGPYFMFVCPLICSVFCSIFYLIFCFIFWSRFRSIFCLALFPIFHQRCLLEAEARCAAVTSAYRMLQPLYVVLRMTMARPMRVGRSKQLSDKHMLTSKRLLRFSHARWVRRL